MSKKKKNKLKLKKLIENRLKQLESGKAANDFKSKDQSKTIVDKPKEKPQEEKKEHLQKTEPDDVKTNQTSSEDIKEENSNNSETRFFKYDLLKVFYILLIVIILFLVIYYLNSKTNIFNPVSNYLFSIFNRS